MKKYVARNRKKETCFCKYEILSTGMLIVEYFVPLVGFSYIANPSKLCRTLDRRTTCDGRKSVITYLIHPLYWCGEDLDHQFYSTVHTAINKCFTENITLDYYGSRSV